MQNQEELVDESFFTGKELEEKKDDFSSGISQKNAYNDKQIGSIAKYIEPINGNLPIENLIDMFTKNPDLKVVPVEENDHVIGVIDRKTVAASTNTVWKKFTAKNVGNYVQEISNVILYAQDFIEKAVVKISEINKHFGTFYFPVFENKTFFGIVSIEDFLSRISEIRERDLEKASLIQCNYFAQKEETDKLLYSVQTWNKMANALGGDFYQVYRISKTKSAVCCFDVSGKNVAASLLTIAIGSFFKMLQFSQIDVQEPCKVIALLDEYLNSSIPAGNFITAAFCLVDLEEKTLQIYNCGHTLVYYLYSEEGTGKVVTIKPLMPPLGMGTVAEQLKNPNGKKLFTTLPLRTGAHLNLYSDGFTDMKNNCAQSYGDDRARKFFVNLYFVKNADVFKTIEKTVKDWIEDTMLPDDITIMDLRF